MCANCHDDSEKHLSPLLLLQLWSKKSDFEIIENWGLQGKMFATHCFGRKLNFARHKNTYTYIRTYTQIHITYHTLKCWNEIRNANLDGNI